MEIHIKIFLKESQIFQKLKTIKMGTKNKFKKINSIDT